LQLANCLGEVFQEALLCLILGLDALRAFFA
jgi:hypothetical protein